MFAPRAEIGADGEMRGEVVARAEQFVVGLVVGAGPCETGAGLSKPGGSALIATPAQRGYDANDIGALALISERVA